MGERAKRRSGEKRGGGESESELRALRGEKEEEGEEKEIGRESLTHKHVNFFEYHEKALESLEKKQKAKKSEEDEGNQLGGSGSHLKQPWYAKSTTSFYDDDDDDDDDNEDKKYGRRHYSLPKRVRMQREETERLRLADKNNAQQTNAKEQPFENRPTLTKVMLTDGYVPPSERKRKEKKKKKKKKEKKKKRRRSSSSDDDSGDEKEHELARALKMQKLREERARRNERTRTRKKRVYERVEKYVRLMHIEE